MGDIELLNQLEKVLSEDNIETGNFLDNIEDREREIIRARKEVDEIRAFNFGKASEIDEEINSLRAQAQEINETIRAKEQAIADINADRIPEVDELVKQFYLPIQRALIVSTQKSVSTKLIDVTVGAKPRDVRLDSNQNLKLENHKKSVSALGQLLPDETFKVYAGSTVSVDQAQHFEVSVKNAFELRRKYEGDGTIHNRTFTRDVVFNSISLAAKVILGGSFDGKQWLPT